MNKVLMLIGVIVLFVSPSLAANNELRVFTWSEYMDEAKFSADFEAATGIKVLIDVYESNEDMLAKLQAGGVSQYDIIIPSSYIVPALKGLQLIQPLDHAKIPNLNNVMAKFRAMDIDPDNAYTAPWQWGTVGLMYNKEKTSESDVSSWAVIFDPKKQARSFWLIDDVRSSMMQALIYLGHDPNSTDVNQVKEAIELLTMTKNSKSCLGFKTGVGGKNDVVAGTADVAVVFNGDALREVSDNPEKFGFNVPQEGGEYWIDVMAIPAKAPNADAAHKWINWILSPEVGAELSNYNSYATPNKAALPFIVPEDRNNKHIYPDNETITKLHVAGDLGKTMRLYDEAWTRIKSH